MTCKACYENGPSCVDDLIDPSEYDYVYLSKILQVNNCRPLTPQKTFPYFVESVREDMRFAVEYENDDVMIYKLR